jgi:DNA invertase Pin-like site-specific DNA recombinase
MHESARFRTPGSFTENIKQSFSQLAILAVGTLHASSSINETRSVVTNDWEDSKPNGEVTGSLTISDAVDHSRKTLWAWLLLCASTSARSRVSDARSSLMPAFFIQRQKAKQNSGDEMTVIGYAVSTIDQDLSSQKATLRAAGCKVIRAERRGGATATSRKQLRTILKFLHNGDVLMVTRIDRLAHSVCDLQEIILAIKARGASLKALEQPVDTSTAASKAFLDALGLIAEFETNLRKERQREDIAKAKAEGRYKGRPISIDAAKVRELKAQGKGVTDIAKEMNIARSSVYRALKEPREKSLRQKSGNRRQVSGVYMHRGPLLQPGESAEPLKEGKFLKVRAERTTKQYDMRQTPLLTPDSGNNRVARRKNGESFEKFEFEPALTS